MLIWGICQHSKTILLFRFKHIKRNKNPFMENKCRPMIIWRLTALKTAALKHCFQIYSQISSFLQIEDAKNCVCFYFFTKVCIFLWGTNSFRCYFLLHVILSKHLFSHCISQLSKRLKKWKKIYSVMCSLNFYFTLSRSNYHETHVWMI